MTTCCLKCSMSECPMPVTSPCKSPCNKCSVCTHYTPKTPYDEFSQNVDREMFNILSNDLNMLYRD